MFLTVMILDERRQQHKKEEEFMAQWLFSIKRPCRATPLIFHFCATFPCLHLQSTAINKREDSLALTRWAFWENATTVACCNILVSRKLCDEHHSPIRQVYSEVTWLDSFILRRGNLCVLKCCSAVIGLQPAITHNLKADSTSWRH